MFSPTIAQPGLKRKPNLLPTAVLTAALSVTILPAHADEVADLRAQVQQLATQLMQVTERLQAVENSKTRNDSAEQRTAPRMTGATSTDQNGRPIKAGDSAMTLYDNGNSSMALYGIIEATLSHANHQNGAGNSANGFQVAYFSGNRLGFDMQHGVEEFGNALGMSDLKVIAKLESEFELPTGGMDTNGVFFNRDAWVGLYSKSLGKLTLGRQNTLTRDFTANWGDPFGGPTVSTNEGGYSNVNNFKQLIFYSAGPNGTRYNSAIEWKKEFDEHLIAGLAYAFGSGGNGGSSDPGAGGSVPGDFAKGTAQAASIAYQNIDLGGAKLNLNANFDRANKNDLTHKATLVGGNIVMGPWRLNAGAIHYTAEQGANNSAGTRTDNPWTISLQYRPNKFEYDIGYQVLKGSHAGMNSSGVTLNPFFGDTSGVTAASTADGKKTSVYGAVRYNVDKRTDIYVAADWFKVSDGWVVGDALGNGQKFGAGQSQNAELEVATGIRFKF